MQIPDEIRKCVAFLACRRNSGHAIGGTAFFVGYPLAASEDTLAVYVVTARHVVEEIEKRSDGHVYCRVNTQQQGEQFIPIRVADWIFNDDSRVDVAVAPIALNFSVCDHKLLPLEMFITPEIIARERMGIGDELFFPGLFSQRPGEKANLPIVRVGNIAAMPEEAIETQWGVLPPSYLVEARSLGGLSGSPVFWYRGATRLRSGMLEFGGPAFSLIGLVHGHYAEKGSTWDADESTLVDSLGSSSINMGIAIVVPAEEILATLNHPRLQQQRDIEQRRLVAIRELSAPVPDITTAFEPLDQWITQENTMIDPQAEDGGSHKSYRTDVIPESGEGETPSTNL